MKELKISISDELYEELSNVPDMDSFLAELIENELKVSTGDNVNNPTEITGAESAGEDLPEEAYFELEDFFEEEDGEDDSTLTCDGSLVDPDDLDGCAELFIDLDIEEEVQGEPKPAPDMVSFSEEKTNAPVESMACFQSIVVDLTDRICELEKQIMDMNSNIQFIKDRSVLSDMVSDKVEGRQTSVGQTSSVATEKPENAVPYATLSFPELKIPPELLDDVEDTSTEVENNVAMGSLFEENSYPDAPDVAVEEDPFPDSFSRPLLFGADASTPVPQTTAVGEPSLQADKQESPVPDENVPTTDKLESCILAYLPSGSEVKKDVIKSLLSKRYADSEVESKIDQLLSAGRISNIVKDDRVYLVRVPERESA